MKTMRRKYWAVPMMAMAMFVSVSCTSDEVMDNPVEQPTDEIERVSNQATMNLQGGLVSFDVTTTRAGSEDWTDGAKVYLQFTVGSALVDGVATYNASTAQWVVEYYGTISEGVEAKCEAYYFENAEETTYANVLLTEHTAIYVDKAAVYMFEDNTLTVIANLTPMTGRIRLKGDSGQSYRFSGMKYYDCYNITSNSFTSAEKNYISTVAKDGYSKYYYGFFPDEEEKEICFDDMNSGVSLVKILGENALAVGHSGYLNIPTINNRNGWKVLAKDIVVSGITFRMIRVLYANNSDAPHFYIGETEVTQELWDKVMGTGNNPSTFTGENLPVNNLVHSDCTNFISKLNEKTGMTFRLPTANEWNYAAKGGCVSNSYTYSGSNDWDAVAWCSENSDNMPHPVKSKLPNEIGIYDMSGNVAEFIAGEGNYRSFYGGSYLNSYSGCEIWDCEDNWWSYSTIHAGFRLVIDNIE